MPEGAQVQVLERYPGALIVQKFGRGAGYYYHYVPPQKSVIRSRISRSQFSQEFQTVDEAGHSGEYRPTARRWRRSVRPSIRMEMGSLAPRFSQRP